jgi:transcriptional regulator with XRE-family HTH domain
VKNVSKTLVEKYVEDAEHMRLFQQERSIYEVTAMLEALLEAQGVSRTELAKRLGRTKGWVTQLLDGEANKTIRTVADVCAVLGQEFRSFHQPIQIGRKDQSAPSSNQSFIGTPDSGGAKAVVKLYNPGDFRREAKSSAETLPVANISTVAL